MKKNYNLMKVYKITKKTLALKIDPTKLFYKAQLVIDMQLREDELYNLVKTEWLVPGFDG